MRSLVRFLDRRALRARVRWSQWTLDASLVLGIDPASDPALALRAAQLRSPRNRRKLAACVERLAREPDVPAGGISAAVPIARAQVAEARDSLLYLADLLRHADEVRARGIAMVERLLSDASSVIYTRSARGALELQLQTALDCLVGGRDATQGPAFSISNVDSPELVGQP
jgi:hypothetical protein